MLTLPVKVGLLLEKLLASVSSNLCKVASLYKRVYNCEGDVGREN